MISQSTLAIAIVVAIVIGAALAFRTVQDIRLLGKAAPAAPQAEPKRKPLSDDAISYEHACRSSYESDRWPKRAADFDSFKLGVRFAERAHGIGGSNEHQ